MLTYEIPYNSDHIETAFEMIQIFKEIPVWMKSLSLHAASLNNKPTEEIIQILNNIPAQVASLLIFDGLSNKSLDERRKILQAIPKHVTEIGWGLCFFPTRCLHDEQTLLKAIPDHVTSLDFSFFSYSMMDKDTILESLPKQIISIKPPRGGLPPYNSLPVSVKWSNMIFTSYHSTTTIEGILKNVPAHILSLDLSICGIRNYRDIMTIIQASPKGVTFLELDQDTLMKPIEEMSQIFNTIPTHVRRISFKNGYNSPSKKNTTDDFIQILKKIPVWIKSLYITFEQICNKDDLIKLLQAIPNQVNSINLNCIPLRSLKKEDLREVIRAIPRNIVEMSICLEDLKTLAHNHIKLNTVRYLRFEDGFLRKKLPNISKIFPNVSVEHCDLDRKNKIMKSCALLNNSLNDRNSFFSFLPKDLVVTHLLPMCTDLPTYTFDKNTEALSNSLISNCHSAP